VSFWLTGWSAVGPNGRLPFGAVAEEHFSKQIARFSATASAVARFSRDRHPRPEPSRRACEGRGAPAAAARGQATPAEVALARSSAEGAGSRGGSSDAQPSPAPRRLPRLSRWVDVTIQLGVSSPQAVDGGTVLRDSRSMVRRLQLAEGCARQPADCGAGANGATADHGPGPQLGPCRLIGRGQSSAGFGQGQCATGLERTLRLGGREVGVHPQGCRSRQSGPDAKGQQRRFGGWAVWQRVLSQTCRQEFRSFAGRVRRESVPGLAIRPLARQGKPRRERGRDGAEKLGQRDAG